MPRSHFRPSPSSSPVARSEYAQVARHSLIICASLVQHPGNLGALCRTVEAFRLESLVLADLAITKHAEFRKRAASAQHWQPMQVQSPNDLLAWWMDQRQQGWQIVGLTGGNQATPLNQFVFQPRTVLVLGRELTGIPTNLLLACDAVVEIPQWGMVESLNVQTAGAIAVWEYIRQHNLTQLASEEDGNSGRPSV